MPTFTTAFYDTQKPTRTTNITRLAAANVASGDIQVARLRYPLVGTEAAADIVLLGILPVGAIVIPGLSYVFSADPGTTLTVDIGYEDDRDAFGDGLVLSSGGQINFLTSSPAPSSLATQPITAVGTTYPPGTVIMTVVSANTLTAAVIVYVTITYKLGK